MILKASQRGAAMQLGRHLLNTADNEHVEVAEIRGFVADDVLGAMKEAQAIASGTRCRQHLFSVSLSPPETEAVGVDAFARAIDQIEKRHGLTDHPRIVVFHEKEGRRHAHAVWSRVDAETMTAVPLPFFKVKLREISKGLYLEHGWQMPRGLMDSKERDPRNFDLAEWQQAKRSGRDPRELKGIIQECWGVSDSRAAFSQALETRGLHLAKGDRRGHVAVTYEGEVLSISRVIGKPAKEIVAKLGKPDDLRGVDGTRAHIATVIAPKLRALIAEADKMRVRAMAPLEERRQALKFSHAQERERLDKGLATRRQTEERTRAERLRGGVLGVWDRLTGERAKIQKQNDAEAFASYRRDRRQRDDLVEAQLKDRRTLQKDIRRARHQHANLVLGLHRDLARQSQARNEGRDSSLARSFRRASNSAENVVTRHDAPRRDNARGRDRGPSLDR